MKINLYFHAVNWIIRHDTIEKEAIRFSNYVTERANETGTPPGIPQKYLDSANQLIGGGFNVLVLV